MYLLGLNMPNIKSEALAKNILKERYSKKLYRIHGKINVRRSLFYNEGVGCMDEVKFLLHILPGTGGNF